MKNILIVGVAVIIMTAIVITILYYKKRKEKFETHNRVNEGSYFPDYSYAMNNGVDESGTVYGSGSEGDPGLAWVL
jgi:hypothetical protein